MQRRPRDAPWSGNFRDFLEYSVLATPTATFPNFYCVCFDRPNEYYMRTKFEVRIFTSYCTEIILVPKTLASPESWSPGYAHAPFSPRFWWAFVQQMDHLNVGYLPNLKSVPTLLRFRGVRVAKKFRAGGSPWLCPHFLFPKNPIGIPYRLFLYVHSFSGNFWLEFLVGVAKRWAGLYTGVGNGSARKSVGDWWVPIYDVHTMVQIIPLSALVCAKF